MRLIKLFRSALVKSYQILLGVWLTYYITNHYSLSTFGNYSAQIATLFIFGFVSKLGFDILVLKEKSDSTLFNVILPVYLMILILGLITGSLFALFVDVQAISIVLYSFTLVFSEFLRRKDLNEWYIFLSGGLQYTIQVILFWNQEVADFIGVRFVILISVALPFIVLVLIYHRVIIHAFCNLLVLPVRKVKNVLSESVGQLFFNLTAILNNWLGVYLLSIYGNLEAVAIFAAVKRITNGLSFPQQVLNINLANPLAKSLENRNQLNSILLKQRNLFFYTSITMVFGGLLAAIFLTQLINVPTQLITDLWTVYSILVAMIIVNVLTGPTFIFTRITGGLTKKVFVLILLVVANYSLAIILPFSNKLLLVSWAAFFSMTSINIYLMYTAYQNHGIHLYAKP